MLTVSSLDEGSSMGTAESGTVQAQASVDESSLLDDNDDWGVVTEGDSGVLILEGEEAEAPSLLTEGEDGLQLSLPGTDSVPTIVGSIEALPPAESGGNIRKIDSGEGYATKKEATPPSDFEETPSNKATGTCTSSTPSYCTMNVLTFLLVTTFLLLCVSAVALISHREERHELNMQAELREYQILFLQNDVYDLQQENKRLSFCEEEVERLEKESERMLSLERQVEHLKKENERMVSLELQVEHLHKENERMKQEEELRWENCRKQADDTVLMDNCWLTAKANVRLGDCAKDAKDAFTEFSTSLFDHLQNTSAAFVAAQETSVDEVEETVAKIINKVDSLGKDFGNKMDSLGKALWKGIEIKRTEGDKLNDFLSKMDDTGKSWFKDTLLGLFSEDEEATASSKADEQVPGSLDKMVKGLSEMMTAGETLMVKALEKAGETMEMNHTELLEAAKQAFEEASLTQHVSAQT